MPDILEYRRGLLTPLIAVVAVYIAYQQHLTNRSRLRVELYDRRLKLYKRLMKFLAKVDRDAEPEVADLVKFRADMSEAFFLFGKIVPEYLDRVFARTVELRRSNRRLKRIADGGQLGPDESSETLSGSNEAALFWLSQQLVDARHIFDPYLRLRS